MKLRLFISGKVHKCAKCAKMIYPKDKYTKYDHAKLCYECYLEIKSIEGLR
jgi:hypothetical protein